MGHDTTVIPGPGIPSPAAGIRRPERPTSARADRRRAAVPAPALAASLLTAALLAFLAAGTAGQQRDAGEPDAAGEQTTSWPATLDVDPRREPRRGWALALHLATEGRLGEAVALLEGALAGADAPLRPRLATDRDRIVALAALREQYLERWAEGEERLEVEHEGERLVGRVTAWNGGSLILTMSRGRTAEVPAGAIRPAPMADDIRRHAAELGDPLLHAWGLLLSHDASFRADAGKVLRRVVEDGRELADRIPAIEELLSEGRILGDLHELAVAGLPSGRAAARATLDRIAALRAGPWDQDAVVARHDALRTLARAALGELAERLPNDELLAPLGAVEKVPGGALRVTFAFWDEADVERAFRFVDRSAEEDTGRPALASPLRQSARPRLGDLVLQGESHLRSLLSWEAPLRVDYGLTYRRAGSSKAATFELRLCESGLGGIIRNRDLGMLLVQGSPRRPLEVARGRVSHEIGRLHRVAVVHDGQRVGVTLDGEPMAELSCDGLTVGTISLWCRSDIPLVISSLTIEGRLTQEGRDEQRLRWVDARLDDLLAGDDGSTLDLGAGIGRGAGAAPEERRAVVPYLREVDLGLRWLAAHQGPSGVWSANAFDEQCGRLGSDGPCTGRGSVTHDTGVTGLALLAFLGAGNTDRTGRYAEAVRRGMLHLLSIQAPDGNLAGSTHHKHSYDHAIATVALVEAWALTGRTVYEEAARLALDYLVSLRRPGRGGWRYTPDAPGMDELPEDPSVTAWAVAALTLARGHGLPVDDAVLDAAYGFLVSRTGDEGRVGYEVRGGPSARASEEANLSWPAREAMTAAAVLSRIALDPELRRVGNREAIEKGISLVLDEPIAWDDDPSQVDIYYWYYATHALHRWGGRCWSRWAPGLERIAEHQVRSGEMTGSWDPEVDPWGHVGGRVYSTALLTRCLQVSRGRTVMGR